MKKPAVPAVDVRTTIPAALDAVDELVASVRDRCTSVLPGRALFITELLLREALTNAVLHGCQGDPSRHVRCAVRVRGRRLTASVVDEGGGFDWHTVRVPEAATTEPSGRGIQILRHYANRIRYNRLGNGIAIVRNFC